MLVNLFLSHRRASWASAAALAAASLAVAAAPSSASASTSPTYDLSLFAGVSGASGPASANEFNLPFGIAVNSAGDLYVSNWIDSTVDEITPSGQMAVVAGGGSTTPTAGSTIDATDASLLTPSGLAVDSAGDVFIADEGNHLVEEVTPSGQVSVIAGGGNTTPSVGSTISATDAKLDPAGVAVDGSGDVYITDLNEAEVDEVTPSGHLTVVAGDGTAGTTENGPATGTSLSSQFLNVAVSPAGVLYVADSGNNEVSTIVNGELTIVAGDGTLAIPTDAADATSVGLDSPFGMAFDSAGNLYVSDSGNDSDVYQIAPSGQLTIIAGNGTDGAPTYGGDATDSAFNLAMTIAAGPDGSLYVDDFQNDTVDLMTPNLPPANTAVPTMTGTAAVGDQLTVSEGTWDGGPSSFAYQWQDCNAGGTDCTDISGATASTYTVTAADEGYTIQVVVTATNDTGPTSADSAVTAEVPTPETDTTPTTPTTTTTTTTTPTITTPTTSTTPTSTTPATPAASTAPPTQTTPATAPTATSTTPVTSATVATTATRKTTLDTSVLFEFDSAKLRPSARKTLRAFRAKVMTSSLASLTVRGYAADGTASTDAWAKELSLLRARAVRTFLLTGHANETEDVHAYGMGRAQTLTAREQTHETASEKRKLAAEQRVELAASLN